MLARVRAEAGRFATVAGSAVLAGGLVGDLVTGPGILAAVTAAGLGLAANPKILRAPSYVKPVAIAVYAAPHAGAALILVGERLAPDTGVSLLVQMGAIAAWTGATWVIRPGRLARQLVEEAELQEITAVDTTADHENTEAVVPAEDPDESEAALWWRTQIAVEGGIAPATVLLEHRRVSRECVAAVIGSAQQGLPLPDISKARLSAHLDMPEDLIDIQPVPGRGAGLRLLVIGPRPKPADPEKNTDDEEVWAEIAKTAMPGVELIEATTYKIRDELT
ncbi:hypothetical protein [Streptomyces lavendulae]|uniref:hypothetical protein n=1 Tax=Streptomyces lavendulae TaxID=1914 RepID=UPI0037FE9F1A